MKQVKLNIQQKNALQTLKDEQAIKVRSSIVNSRTMRSLCAKRFIKLSRYANGEFWEMTDFGYEALKKIQHNH